MNAIGSAGLFKRRAVSLALAGLAASPIVGRLAPARAAPDNMFDPFVVYYGYELEPSVEKFRLAVLDSDVAPDAFARLRKTVKLGYLSIGEVSRQRSYFQALAGEGLLGAPNPNWPDAHYVDLRTAQWQTFVTDKLIPGILQRGFDGIFFDTLDNAEFLEFRHPATYAGMMDAAVETVLAVRRKFPRIKIMINRGYGILPRIAGAFDMLLGESVRTRFTSAGTYEYLSNEDYEWQRSHMAAARRRDPSLGVYSLDYWDPASAAEIADIYREQRRNGFIPYVATWDLNRVVLQDG
jgi:polysaccharide biosynthesis protein PelA